MAHLDMGGYLEAVWPTLLALQETLAPIKSLHALGALTGHPFAASRRS